MLTLLARNGALALALLSLAAPSLAQTTPRAERPDVRVGDSSVFEELDVRTGEKRDTTFVVTRVESEKIVAETSGSTSGAHTFTREFNQVEVRTGEVVAILFKPFWPHLHFPLEVGRTWDIPFEVDVQRQPAHVAKWQLRARVVALESVTVPAGTFRAFRIEYDGSFDTREGDKTFNGTHKETAWFALEPMRIVKRDYEQVIPSRNFLEHHVITMLSFKPAP
jgi:hypothetical protein